jgi:hypothetical protein
MSVTFEGSLIMDSQMARALRLIDKWQPLLGLADWDICLKPWVPDDDDDTFIRAMSCRVNWEYMDAVLYLNIKYAEQAEDALLEESIIHELYHVIVAEMAGAECHHEERVVTMLTKAMQRATAMLPPQPEGE